MSAPGEQTRICIADYFETATRDFDGRFAPLLDVVNHYNSFKGLNLSETEKNDLVEYLKSL